MGAVVATTCSPEPIGCPSDNVQRFRFEPAQFSCGEGSLVYLHKLSPHNPHGMHKCILLLDFEVLILTYAYDQYKHLTLLVTVLWAIQKKLKTKKKMMGSEWLSDLCSDRLCTGLPLTFCLDLVSSYMRNVEPTVLRHFSSLINPSVKLLRGHWIDPSWGFE